MLLSINVGNSEFMKIFDYKEGYADGIIKLIEDCENEFEYKNI
jgi:hypothetical protein